MVNGKQYGFFDAWLFVTFSCAEIMVANPGNNTAVIVMLGFMVNSWGKSDSLLNLRQAFAKSASPANDWLPGHN
jgi:hypothetical protein